MALLRCLALAILLLPAVVVPAGTLPPVSIISATPGGASAAGWSFRPALSADGSAVAFTSNAADLVPGDSNAAWDVFVRDLPDGEVELVSRSTQGDQGTRDSGFWSAPSISADGSRVVYASQAANLVSGDSNRSADIFFYDRLSSTTTLVSHNASRQAASGWSDWPSISPDGRYISFSSTAPDLVSGDHNARRDIFLADTLTGSIELVSASPGGIRSSRDTGWASAVSENGRYILFSTPDNLLEEDSNSAWDVYLKDMASGRLVLISVSTQGVPGNADSGYWSSLALSADGSLAAFQSSASNLVNNDRNTSLDIFVRDWRLGLTRRSSLDSEGHEVRGGCAWPALSPDGAYVSFTCPGGSLTPGDANAAWDVFVRDIPNHFTTRVSVTAAGLSGALDSGYWSSASLSRGASRIAFASLAGNLASPDRNRRWDVFLADFAWRRGQNILAAAAADLGMPYCLPTEEKHRACPGDGPCEGPYYGYNCGVCTDLVMDSILAGAGWDMQSSLLLDALSHPDHLYEWRDMRSAGDMFRYFEYTGSLLAEDEPSLPGDMVFFDWDADGWVDHVALVSEVRSGKPSRLLSAEGKIATNPDGLTREIRWRNDHTRSLTGRARLP